MLVNYKDITDRAGEPDWHDQNGTPRYGTFHPHKVTIYNQKVSLYEIECQDCGKTFKVAHVWPEPMDFISRTPVFGGPPPKVDDEVQDQEAWEEWGKQFKDPDTSQFHFGDPPAHGCVGDTMNSIPLRCLEHWERINFEWNRVTQKEVEVGALWVDAFDDVEDDVAYEDNA